MEFLALMDLIKFRIRKTFKSSNLYFGSSNLDLKQVSGCLLVQETFLGTFRSILSPKIFRPKKTEGVSLGFLAKRDGYYCYK